MKRLRRLLERISAKERRTVAVGALVMITAWAVLRAAPHAIQRTEALRARAALASASLVRAREVVAAEPAARESLAARAGRLVAIAPRLLGGETAAEATSELASLVGGAAAMRQVRLVQQDARPDSGASVFTRITMRLEAEGDVGGIAAWLADLEEGPKLISVVSLSVNAPEPGASGTQAERLRAAVVIQAWASGRKWVWR